MKWFRNKHAQAIPDPDEILSRIWECFCQHQDEEAAKLIQKLEGLQLSDPQRCIFRVYRGWLAYRKGAWEEAEQHAHWVLEQCQDRYSLGKAYHLMGHVLSLAIHIVKMVLKKPRKPKTSAC